MLFVSDCHSRNWDLIDQASSFCGGGVQPFIVQHLHTLVLKSGYLSYCCLPISLNQSGLSPLTSDINKAFSPREPLFTGYFPFFSLFSVNPRDFCVGKIPINQQFLKYSAQPIMHQQPCSSDVHFEFQQVISIMFTCSELLPRDWLIILLH